MMVTSRAQLQAVLGPCLTRRTSSVYPCISMTRNCRLRPLCYITSFLSGFKKMMRRNCRPSPMRVLVLHED